MPFKRYVQRYRLDLDSAVADQESDVGSRTQPARLTNRFGHNQAASLVDGSFHGINSGISGAIDQGARWESGIGVDKTHTLDVDWVMAPDFDWNEEKNQRLVEQRGISFERIVSAIEQGGLVDVLEHPNQERYRGQMIYVVDIEQYLYLVPFVTGADGTRFLKTIIPSRKATRDYQRRRSS